MFNNKKDIFAFILIDVVIIVLAYILAILTVKVIGGDSSFENISISLVLIIAFKLIVNYVFGVYKFIPKYFDFRDVTKIVLLSIVTNVVLVLLLLLPVPKFMHKSIYLFITTFEIIGLVSYRLMLRFGSYIKSTRSRTIHNSKITLIIGAGSAGELALKELNQNKDLNNYVLGFLDDDYTKHGKTISNKPILGDTEKIKEYILNNNVEEIVLAINNYPKVKMNMLLEVLNEFPTVKLKRINLIDDINDNEVLRIIDIKVEDLLDREEIKLDNDGLFDFINNEVVMVTGGGGSIGSELCRQIFELKPKKLIIFDIYENNAYEIQMELERLKYKNKEIKTEIIALIGSVYNKARLESVFNEYTPNIVFHAAAYKHVPLMEQSPVEAIRTNVIGTYNTASLANQYGVKKMVLVSSDKAVRSTNVMGATKRYAELIIGYFNTFGNTKFSAVRFGNVLGSNGSVIPLFKKQIEDGGPLTVTHKDITRYFMTIPESVGLILQSAVYADGGEIFILDMGDPVKIYDLAVKMIMLSGLRPNVDICIEVVGLRPGEKLYEELLVDRNNNDFLTTDHSRIFIEPAEERDYSELDLDYIINNYESYDNDHIKKMVAHVVKSYKIDGDKDNANS